MANTNLVLVTGSSGRVGQAVVAELGRQGLPVRGFDRLPTPGLADMVVGNLLDEPALARAMTGVTTLVHLAATPDDDEFVRELVPNNIVGVYHVFEAARHAGVERLVLASSGQVVWYQRQTGPLPIGVDAQPSPRYWYAACKLFLEGAGRAYAEAHGLTVLAVRLGWCPRTKEQAAEIAAQQWARNVYLSPADAGRFFARAVQAPLDCKFAILYAASKPPDNQTYDLEAARTLIGYEPRDTWPQGVEVVTG